MAKLTDYSYGSETYSFTEPVGRIFECPVCQGVVKEAQSVRCCKKTFCKRCLDEALKKFNKCPLCRTANPVSYENEAIDDGVNDLKVLCLHRGKGCQWSGHLLYEPQHREEKCDYEEVECENRGFGCGVVSERRFMKQHVVEKCAYREVTCEYCGELKKVWAMGAHLETCPKHPVECVNGCGEEGLLRRNLAGHLEFCPDTVVDCPFKEMGCRKGKLKRKDIQSHTTNAVSDHLALVMKTLVETKRHCEQAMKKQESYIAENKYLKSSIEQLKIEAGAYRMQTESLKARIDQLQVEADAHREETKGLKAHIEELQVTRRRGPGAKVFPAPAQVKACTTSKDRRPRSRAADIKTVTAGVYRSPVYNPPGCKTPGCLAEAVQYGLCENCSSYRLNYQQPYDDY